MIVEGIVLALRSLPFGTDETVKAQFLTNEPELYNVEFKQKGCETIKTPGGEVECYKVELVPKLGALNVFKVFFPKTYFWFTVAPPHKWVRYEGFGERTADSPEVVMEAVPVKKSGQLKNPGLLYFLSLPSAQSWVRMLQGFFAPVVALIHRRLDRLVHVGIIAPSESAVLTPGYSAAVGERNPHLTVGPVLRTLIDRRFFRLNPRGIVPCGAVLPIVGSGYRRPYIDTS